MHPVVKKLRLKPFFKAYCIDCREFKLQSFSKSDVEDMIDAHGSYCNHEMRLFTDYPRRNEMELNI